jgi:hypothetical protein
MANLLQDIFRIKKIESKKMRTKILSILRQK